MRRTLHGSLVCAALAALLCAASPAQDPPKEGKPDPKQPDPKRVPLDKLKPPPGTVIVLTEDIDKVLKQLPRAVFLSPEKYQELIDRLAQLEKLLKPERRPPSACRLRAAVEGDVVLVQAEFAFTTEQPRTVVPLGCRGGQLTDARLRHGDGEGVAALLDPAPDGYAITAEKAGEYHLTLSLKVPLAFGGGAARGGERSFDLVLPGAAVTTLTLDLPHAVKELRWNKVTEKARPAGKPQKRWEDIPIGKVTALTVSWHEPPPANDAGPLLTAKGHVVVRLEDHQAVVTAELALTDLRARATAWRLWLPPQATVKVTPPEGVTCKVTDEGDGVHALQLSEATGDPVKVTVTTVQPRPFKVPLAVGPFTVIDAFRQDGTVEVRATAQARRGVRPQYQLQGTIEERDPPRELAGGDLLAFFRYWNMPAQGKASPKGKGPPTAAPLHIELKQAEGRVETFVEHRLRVRPQAQPAEGYLVEVTTRIQAKPLGDPVDFLDVQLPRVRPEALAPLGALWPLQLPDGFPLAGLAVAARAPQEGEWLAGGGEALFPDANAKKQRRARLRLQPGAKGSTVELTGVWTLAPGTQRVRLEVPRPVVLREGRGKVRLEAEGGLELVAEDVGSGATGPGRQQHSYDTDSAPAFIDFGWRPYRPELPVHIEADVTLHERDAAVRQQFAFTFPERPAAGERANEVRLRVPAGVQGLDVSAPWEVVGRDSRLGLLVVAPRGGASARAPLAVSYRFDLPRDRPKAEEDGPREFEVPLLWPEQATRAATRVRLWGRPGTLPALAEGDDTPWRDRGTEVVAGRGLPSRVLVGDGLRLPLWLRLDPAPPLLAGVVIDRALVQVKVDEEGSEEYRVRYLLSNLHAPHLDLKLPAPGAGLSLQVRLAGAPASWGYRGEGGRVVRVPLGPGLPAGPIVLEVTYRLPRNQPEGEGLWQTSLHPPEVLGNVFLGRVRWQVTLPPGWLPVALGSDVHAEVEWGWRGWLPGPQAAETAAKLEEWVSGQATADDGSLPSLVCSRTTMEPLRLLRPPLQAWFLICSGTLLLAALLLYTLPLSPSAFWLTTSLLAVGLVAAGLVWPAALPPVIYGCLPGAAVLAALALVQWTLHQRYRRRVVFMPGFKRAKPGSSLVRTTSLRPREPSTVDAPASTSGLGQGSAVSKK